MGFFGDIVSELEPLNVDLSEGIHLELHQAAIDFRIRGKSVLFVKQGDFEYIICCLDSEKKWESSLRHKFSPDDSPIIFRVEGEPVHLTGSFERWDSDFDDADDSVEGEEEQAETEEGETEEEKEEPPAAKEPPRLAADKPAEISDKKAPKNKRARIEPPAAKVPSRSVVDKTAEITGEKAPKK